MSHPTKYDFCFDLSYNHEVSFFLPSIFLLEKDSSFNYVEKKITKDNLSIFTIEWEALEDDIKKLFEIEKTLQVNHLGKKFSISKKKSFIDLKSEKNTFNAFINYIDSKIHLFLSICKKNDYSVSINLNQEKTFYKFKKNFSCFQLNPYLKFDKHDNGMHYSLFLESNKDKIIPSTNKTLILSNNPCWIVMNDSIHQVNYINGNKIKPFIDKDKIEIPTYLTATYFQKFIKDVIKHGTIEANGFKVEKNNCLLETKASIIYDFFKDTYALELQFVYKYGIFLSTSNQKNKTDLNIEDLDNISVFNQERDNSTESQLKTNLIAIGLIESNGLFFPSNPKETNLFSFLTDYREDIENAGIKLVDLSFDHKKIKLEKPAISFNKAIINDWFDLKIKITIGAFEIDFVHILENIRNNDPFFKLEDETFFVIPTEWMQRFSTLQHFIKKEKNQIKLPKNKAGLLNNFFEKTTEIDVETKPYQPSNLVKTTLRPYQKEGVQWLMKNYHNQTGACLADDMGLGKTLQTLAMLVAIQEEIVAFESEGDIVPLDLFSIKTMKKEALRALIVLPNTLLFNWYNETQKFTPHFSKIVYSGPKRKENTSRLLNYDVIFTTYAIVSKDIELLQKMNFRVVILDESQQIKNKDSKIFQAINSINTSFRVSLSGTPIENSLSDLWAQMQFINPDILGSFTFFTKNFIVPIQKQQSEKALQTLLQIIQPFLLRRTRASVLKELPELSEQIVFCEMNKEQKKWYETEKSKARNQLLQLNAIKVNKIHVLNTLMKLRQLSNHPKLVDTSSSASSGKFEEVTHYLENIRRSNLKVLVFSAFVSHIQLYVEWCKQNNYKYSLITGAVKDRQNEVIKFENDNENHFFFISLKSGSSGLNLTAASFVFLLDPWWNPSIEEQAIARSYRMGQKNKVAVMRFVSKETIEEKILMLQKTKKDLFNSVISEEMIEEEITSKISEILS
ncbi:DEAD/DEAH box helicase [Flavobacterium cucumis]|uniref:Non-specific serine/threonine protein kinase n=1 Tax=Flavobacterium cucumis TaxID=416016 RepID=A0A1M7ZT73_9FLAO|nr:DEAD/DEAH box helicase [Flavobacterium cucumis]SHO72003.1 non-specific serine/threonine protein kinase [Flavobacterium cucumis]